MNRIPRSFGFALLSASLTAVVLAQAPALDVKMGLWEMTSTMDVGGQLPTVDTSKMTPDQKARMEAAMKNMTGHPNVTKTCMTKEKFDKSSFMATDRPDSTCKQTLTTNTRTTLEATVACTGATEMTGQLHVDALSPTSIKANVQGSRTAQGQTMTVQIAMTGTWLGADCGNIK